MRYTTLDAPEGGGVDWELDVKRSRFLAVLRRVPTEDAARAVVDSSRRAHFTARHHCSAFILGPDGRTARSSDDGEPAGTAGVPMLNVLLHHRMSDVVAVVTRYFGGIKLGAGGLVRAYSEAVAGAVERAGTRTVELRQLLRVSVPMAEAGSVEGQLRLLAMSDGLGLTVDGVSWDEEAHITVSVAMDREADVIGMLSSVSGGALHPVPAGQRWVDAR